MKVINFALASVSLSDPIYVDDIFEGADNENTALKIKIELIEHLSLRGVPLDKRTSNCFSLAENSEILHIKESDPVLLWVYFLLLLK